MSILKALIAAALLALPVWAQDEEQAKPAPAPTEELAEGWDFIPGEKLLLYDDFTDMAKGAAPPHWKVRGGTVKLAANGRLLVNQDVQLTPNVVNWPKNFTIESDVLIKGADGSDITWMLNNAEGDWILRFWARCTDQDEACAAHLDGSENLAQVETKFPPGRPFPVNIWLQDGRVRVYWNKERIIDVNQVELKGVASLTVQPSGSETTTFSFGRFRIAESAPDISQTILSTGRFVTHGIQFDVNSDQLKPESMTVLRQVAAALEKQPALRLRIEGHTDSSGDAAKNLDLSKRRAASVKTALTGLGIAADRLTTEGLGASKPLSPNDTPQGRANNRRVEFVKI